MLTAIWNKQPDMVPVAPDISNMIPAKLLGKPFWSIYKDEDPPLWRGYVEAVKYFKFDGWFIYGGVEFKPDPQITEKREVVKQTEERIIESVVYSTPAGDMTEEWTYYIADPPTPTVKRIKDLEKDFPKLRYFYPEILDYDSSELEIMRKELGDLGVLGVGIGYPGFQNWFYEMEGGLEALTYTYYDHHDLIEEWVAMEDRYIIRQMEMLLDAKPDFVLLGASGTITLQSPALFRELGLPTVKKLTKMAKEAGIPTMLHSCGKERALVEICANETDLNCINPLEIPPMGDCDLAEIKGEFGDKLSLMGNIHTTEVMLMGSVEDVERVAKKCIDDAAKGGGFILSTGDQCGRDTPDENIFKLIEVARTYGKY